MKYFCIARNEFESPIESMPKEFHAGVSRRAAMASLALGATSLIFPATASASIPEVGPLLYSQYYGEGSDTSGRYNLYYRYYSNIEKTGTVCLNEKTYISDGKNIFLGTVCSAIKTSTDLNLYNPNGALLTSTALNYLTGPGDPSGCRRLNSGSSDSMKLAAFLLSTTNPQIRNVLLYLSTSFANYGSNVSYLTWSVVGAAYGYARWRIWNWREKAYYVGPVLGLNSGSTDYETHQKLLGLFNSYNTAVRNLALSGATATAGGIALACVLNSLGTPNPQDAYAFIAAAALLLGGVGLTAKFIPPICSAASTLNNEVNAFPLTLVGEQTCPAV